MTDFINMRINRYEIRERIGAGGMARVFKAWDTTLERPVALKILHDHLADDPTFKERFTREARFVANLNHPNIVQVYDFNVIERGGYPVYYMVMSYIPGNTLRDLLHEYNERGERLPLERIYHIMRNLTDAIGYAHANGMVHRDVKPGNILLNTQGEAILTDFGIARMIESSRLTQEGISTGTPLYMSPEQVSGSSGDARSDLYSLGIILYEMLTGKPPFDDNGSASVMLKHITTPIPSISEATGLNNPAWDRLIYKALAKEPEDRYQTAGAMFSDIKAVLVAGGMPEIADQTYAINTSSNSRPAQAIQPAYRQTPASGSQSQPFAVPSATQTVQQAARTSFAFLGGVVITAIVIIVAAIIILRNQVSETPEYNAESMTGGESSLTQPVLTAGNAYFNTRFNADDPVNAFWPQHEVGGFSEQITADGFYSLTLTRPNTAEASVILSETPYTSVGIELEGVLDSPSVRASAYGIIFRYQDPDNYHVFAVDGEGRYSIWIRQNGEWTELRQLEGENWTPNENIHPIDQPNRLTLSVSGDTFTGYVNDHRVIRISDSTFSDGQIGIYVASDEGDANVRIDSFKVYPSIPSMTGQ